ncbi:MAG: ceramidase domain-containing protein [bacterium]
MDWKRQYIGLWIGAALFVLSMIVFFILAVAGWPGGPDKCLIIENGVAIDSCYCETLRSGLVKQPANTWSDLAFVIVGLSLLVIIGKENHDSGAVNAMLSGGWIASLYCWVIIFMGPGSMYFHASMVNWAGFIDSTSMFLLLTFIIGYDLYQVTSGEVFSWLSWVIALAVLTLALILVIVIPEVATYIFIGFAVSTGIFDLILHLASNLKRKWRWYITFFAVFGGAVVIWILSGTGMPLCSPDAVFLQGHAWWHILSAIAMIFLFLYFRSETGGRAASA